MRVPVSGGAPEFVAELAPGSEVRCARLPSTLCILAEPGSKQLFFYALDPVNGRGRELARTEATPDFSGVDLSPDRWRIALSIWKGAEFAFWIWPPILLANLEVKEQHELADLAWSADGKGLFVRSFGHMDSSERRLLYVGLDGAVRVLLRNITAGGPYLFRLSPDGRHLAWAENMWDANAWMLENF